MEIIKYEFTIEKISQTTKTYFTENTLLFDIECTGLSPRKSFVYLIGFAIRKGNSVKLTQFLAKNESDEINLLIAFNDIISQYEKLMGFNSTRFDQSFLLERYKKYKLTTELSSKKHIDIYLTITKAKCILNLNNYKQKTLELFLGINRDDKFDGGQLIPVYEAFSKTGDIDAKKLVLLHNMEDVKGMIDVIDIISYTELLNANFSMTAIEQDSGYCTITFSSTQNIPKLISKSRPYGQYIAKNNQVVLSLNMISDTLNTYLADYKNYLYLINENMIIPKVLGESIDKENKRPATKFDCKISKKGSFVEIPERIILSSNEKKFKTDYNSKEYFLQYEDINSCIATQILKFMLKH